MVASTYRVDRTVGAVNIWLLWEHVEEELPRTMAYNMVTLCPACKGLWPYRSLKGRCLLPGVTVRDCK